MRLSEKKFICDVASVLFAAAVICCGLLAIWDYALFAGAATLILGLGALMFLSLLVRNLFTGRKVLVWVFGILAAVLLILCALSLVVPGGA